MTEQDPPPAEALIGFGDDTGTFGVFGEGADQYVDFPPDVVATIRAVWTSTVTSPERIAALIAAVEHVVGTGLDGDLVECGIWRGGSVAVMARTLLARGPAVRALWMYDTFEGMVAPTAEDVDYENVSAAVEFAKRRLTDKSSTWAAASLDEVLSVLAATGYPDHLVRPVVGPVEDTLPARAPERIALLRLDTDFYSSTWHELVHLYPRLVSGGILIIDDYGHWRGARQAVDEYFASLPSRPFLHRIDYSGRLIVKP